MNTKPKAFLGLAATALALLTQTLALPALAQSPLPDSFNPGANSRVLSLALQADGKILVGGLFSMLGGQSRINIGRLNADGTVDTTFNPGADNGVNSLALQADGKILMGGGYSYGIGGPSGAIDRLNADGTVDTTFNHGADSDVSCLALQADGKILVGRSFTSRGGQSRNSIGRLNADGTPDLTFNPGADGGVYSLALQADGKILVGGYFTTLGGQSRNRIGRLNVDGTVDTSFNPGAGGTPNGYPTSVSCLALQADGKILVGGYFDTLGGQSRSSIGRLNADGTVDTTFNPGADSGVLSLTLQADGRILVGGWFSTLGGQNRRGIGRLNADGTVDTSFNPGADSDVYSLALQADGKILVGGEFTTLGGQSRTNIGRLNNTTPATQSLMFDGSTLTWTRGGSSPEVWRTTFEYSPDGGSSMTNLGAGIRIPGLPAGQASGWQLTGLALPTNTIFRARGYTVGGDFNGSSWFVETYIGSGSVIIGRPPASLTSNAGATAAFSVYAVGSGPLSYQWRKNGVNLADGGNVSGAATASLTLSNVLGGDAGGYSVVITNAAGSVTSPAATLSVIDPLIILQPVSQVRNPGDSVTFSVGVAGTAPFSYQWRHGGGLLAGATRTSLTLTNLQGADAGSYDIVVSNAWGSAASVAALLTVNLAVPDSFNPGADSAVNFLALQADGKILAGGQFTTLGGQSRNRIGRLNADGSMDPSFNPGADGAVNFLALQADGKILVGGDFATLGGQSRSYIGRLNADGTLDTSFNPGANSDVYCLALQADGKIVVGGYFSTLGGQGRANIGRLNPDGTLDPSFNPGANDVVLSLALQADGKILVGGNFTTLGGQSRSFIGRLNADGTVDPSLNPGADGGVNTLALQADGKILVGGNFGMLAGQGRSYIGRLNPDGSLDTGFNPGADSGVNCLALQADGKILVGGWFATLGGQSRSYIGRLNADGTLDPSFNPGADGGVNSLALQADGKILVGGGFTMLGGQSRANIGRLNNTEPATESLTFDGSTLTWMRGGSSPELWRTTFEYSPDGGSSLTNLGAGIRITGLPAGQPGGWQLTGLALPTNTIFRARGYTVGGYGNSSGWFVETYLGSLVIGRPPASLTSNAGATAGFNVYAVGSGPLSYQWRKNGINLADGGKVSGAATAILTLSNVLGGDAGGYSVVITNAAGSVTSPSATLTVIDPLIILPPVSQARNPGDSVTFTVGASGTAPFSYQWRHGGGLLAGATRTSLTLTNLQGADAGSYDVVVSNVWSSTTRAAALLTVNLAVPDSFNPGANSFVLSLALQADGRILVGGGFTTLGGQIRTNIGRLNTDGTLDPSFNPGADNEVLCLALQADGKILVGRSFSMTGVQSRSLIGRLNADGSLDPNFNPEANSDVSCLALQADGKILVGGYFSTLGGQSRSTIGRLNADGTLDPSFNPGADNVVNSLALQADGKILVGGWFRTLGGQSRNTIGRLNADGTVDPNFNPGADGGVYCLALQADGKILVGGDFTTLGGQSRNYMGRLNADGSLDTSFNPGANNGVYSLALQADGKILVGGNFGMLAGQGRRNIGRLNADGTLDPSFNPGANDVVLSLALQADGKILVGGDFTTLGGQIRNHIGRLNNTDPATQSLTFDGSTLTWTRGGTSPEVWRTTFEYSSDGGASWTNLGEGIRIPGLPAGQPGGWQLTGLALPTNTTFRARGYIVGGNGSSWFVEAVLQPLAISAAFHSADGHFGFSASGPAGQVVVIEASPDLRTWTPMQTNTLGAGPILFTDPQPALLPSRFYRVRAGL